MRTFIAVDLPVDTRRMIGAYADSLSGVIPDVKWVDPDNFHLTMKFLGEITPAHLETVQSCAAKVAEEFEPFTIGLEHLGFFPDAQRPRVVWIGASAGVDRLLELYQDIEECLETAGFDREAKTYSPHLTIGRVKRHARITVPPGVPEFDGVSFTARGLCVVENTLTPQGAQYRTLHEAPFEKLIYQNP